MRRMIDELRIGKDLEGSDPGLNPGTIPALG
jgi:hypothetical protein